MKKPKIKSGDTQYVVSVEVDKETLGENPTSVQILEKALTAMRQTYQVLVRKAHASRQLAQWKKHNAVEDLVIE